MENNNTEKKLYTAKDLMTTNVVTLTKRTKVSDAIITLGKYGISGAPVVDSYNKIIGMFTESDILRYFSVHPSQEYSMLNLKIVFDEKEIITAKEETPLYIIQRILMENGFRAIPIVDNDNKPIGMISRRDIMKFIFVMNNRLRKEKK